MALANHRINIYHASIDEVLSKVELRFSGNDQEILFAFGNIYQSEIPDRESFPRVAKFYKIDGKILLKPSRKCTVFIVSLD